jgi:plastocyanin
MLLRDISVGLSIAVITLGLAAAANAGQVRVTVGPSMLFVPRAVNANVGDKIVWVWAGSGHTSTSGDSSTVTSDGHWDSGFVFTIGAGFMWRVTGGGTFLYYCSPHAPPMAGRVIVNGSAIDVSDFRITEAQYNEASGHDRIEITNLGAATGDLGRYRLSVNAGAATVIPPSDVLVSPGGTVTIHTNETGTNSATDVYLGAILPLPDAAGALALYVPAPTATSGLAVADQMVDYVEWGAGGGANEATAMSAGYWGAGQSVPVVTIGHSIEFCASPSVHDANRWFDNDAPNFSGAADNCATPVHTSTWGRLKALYR